MKITEKTIQAVLMQWLMTNKHECVVPNTTNVFSWEADLISVTKAGLAHEFEIKISASDYKADARKVNKHWRLQNTQHGPAYFWYVTYGFEIDPPPYAGWMKVVEVHGAPRCQLVVPAPRLHNNKITDKQRFQILRSLSWQLANMSALLWIKRPMMADGEK